MTSVEPSPHERVLDERRQVVALVDGIVQHSERLAVRASFSDLAELKAALVRLEIALFDNATAAGWSWSEIGNELNITKQSAFKRYRRLQHNT